MSKYDAPAPPYIEAKYQGGNNRPIDRIVMHSTVGATESGSAYRVARYFQNPSRVSSAHYVRDEDSLYQCVYDSVVAYHAPPNGHSIGYEMCDNPQWGREGRRRWKDKPHRTMFAHAARDVAQLCLAYDVPAWFVKPWRLRRGAAGVTTHHAVTKAWGQTDHTDPRAWPRRKFMRRVRREVRRIERGLPELDYRKGPRP